MRYTMTGIQARGVITPPIAGWQVAAFADHDAEAFGVTPGRPWLFREGEVSRPGLDLGRTRLRLELHRVLPGRFAWWGLLA